MPYISFGDKDRERFGIAEWLEFHPADISIVDLGELAELCNFDHMEWPEAFWGDIPFEQAGSPDAKRVPPKWQLQATAWMTLRQNGVRVSWDEASTVRAGWMRWSTADPNAPAAESPGKEPTPAKASRTRAASTTPRSGTSSPRSRRKT